MGGGRGCEGWPRKNRKFRRVVEIRGVAWRGGWGGRRKRVGVTRGCLLVRVRWHRSRGIHRWIRGMMRRWEGRACRGDVRVEGEWVNCKTRSSVFLS